MMMRAWSKLVEAAQAAERKRIIVSHLPSDMCMAIEAYAELELMDCVETRTHETGVWHKSNWKKMTPGRYDYDWKDYELASVWDGYFYSKAEKLEILEMQARGYSRLSDQRH